MSVSDLLARKMVEKHVIEKEEFELYQYSINAISGEDCGSQCFTTIRRRSQMERH